MHREFMRSAVLVLTPLIPVTACHQRNDVERYHRSIGIVSKPVQKLVGRLTLFQGISQMLSHRKTT